jgi:hypothetical protein
MESTKSTTVAQGVRLLSPQEVHERTGIAVQTLANWRSTWPEGVCRGPQWIKTAGQPGTPGGRVGYPEDKLAVYLANRTMTPA